MDLPSTLPESMVVDTITPTDFLHQYIRPNRPLLMRHMMDTWPATTRWTFDFFGQMSLAETVHFEAGNVMQEQTHFVKMDFRHYMQRLLEDSPVETGIGQPPNAYLSLFDIFAAFPQLRQDVDFSVLSRHKIKNTISAWIGPAGTVTGYHIDWGDNILAQIRGHKRVYLVSPEQTPLMYQSNKFDQGTTISQVNIDHFDPDAFPLFNQVKSIEIVLQPGQMLFIPRGWWHYVQSLDKSISVSNLGFDVKGLLCDAIPHRVKQMLHDVGFYPCPCTCHIIRDGKRVRK